MKNAIITIWLVVAVSATCACGADRLVPSQYPTIQAAVYASKNGDTVIIAPGTYTGPGNRDIVVNQNITIRSQDGPETCIIDCNGSPAEQHIGFYINAGSIAGITITGGYSTRDEGSAITCSYGSRVKLTNCILTNNRGTMGGAVFCNRGNMEIANCFLINNVNQGSGGAISCQDRESFLMLANCTISGNSAGRGGGIIVSRSNIIVKNCVISNNRADPMDGGGIYCVSGSVLVADSSICGNSSRTGGGIYCLEQGNITVKNSVITENSAMSENYNYYLNRGGGIYCERGTATIIGSDISQNSASQGAGAYFILTKSLFISDCNFYNNTAGGINGYMAWGGAIYFANPDFYSMSGAVFPIINSFITDNIAKGTDCRGGGLYIETPTSRYPQQNVNIMLSGCVIARNSAQAQSSGANSYGGGIYTSGRVLLSLSETDIIQNSAIRGGGIYNGTSGFDMSRCRISGNSAIEGSAISYSAGETTLESCAISGNRALRNFEQCPVIWRGQSAILRIANCTIVGNIPPVVSPPANPLPSITNSIIYWNSQNPRFYWKFTPNYFSITYSDIQGGYAGTGNIDADPCFAIPGHWDTNGTSIPYDDFWVEGNYRLMAVSPCIDSGGTVFLMDNKDLAGKPRIAGIGIDIGAYEYQNTAPMANAGEDVNVFAWVDGNASVTLDGSGSYDADGDNLTYLWNWSINGNTNEANGISPTIELPVGVHTIELVVNDGLKDSEPNEVVITVVEPIECRLWILPRVINRQGNQLDIWTTLKLPAGVTKDQIDIGHKLMLYPGGIEAQRQSIRQYLDDGDEQIAVWASFDRSSLLTTVQDNGPVQLDVVGRFNTGQYFFGRDTVRIIDHNPNHRP